MEMKGPGERYGAFHSFETAFFGKALIMLTEQSNCKVKKIAP